MNEPTPHHSSATMSTHSRRSDVQATGNARMRRSKAYAFLIVTMIGWGSLYVAAKPVLTVIPAFTLLALRYLIALIVLIPLYHLSTRLGKTVRPRRHDLPKLWAIGALGYFLAIGCQLIGNNLCAASTASLINSMNPILMTLLAAPLLHEHATVRQWMGIAISAIGAAAIIGVGNSGSNTTAGIIFSLASLALWSLASVLFRLVASNCTPLAITVHGFAAGAVLALIAAPLEAVAMPHSLRSASITSHTIALIAFIGVVCTAIALMTWNQALALTDTATCSSFYPLQALTSAVFGAVFLHEALTARFLVGFSLIATGILFCMAHHQPDMERRVPKNNQATSEAPR